ncbi:MAG: hypothetical protein AMXMBFR59_16670 [Rhodanobacteraceae bacterium]
MQPRGIHGEPQSIRAKGVSEQPPPKRRRSDFGALYFLAAWGVVCGLFALTGRKPFLYGFFVGTAPVVFIGLTGGATMSGIAWVWKRVTGEEPGTGVGFAALFIYVFVVAPLLVLALRAIGVPIR